MTVLVLAAHPDDAELAMGGTIAALCDAGTDVVVSCFTTSERDEESRLRRRAAAEKAAVVLGHRVEWVRDGAHDQVDELRESELVGLVDAEIERWDPQTVFTHWEHDSHGDHVALARAVIAASRRSPRRTFIQFGPAEHGTPAHAAFVPNTYVELSAAQLGHKLDALGCYVAAGMSVRPLDLDAVTVKARYRGMEIGTELAEAFRVLRQRIELVGVGEWPGR